MRDFWRLYAPMLAVCLIGIAVALMFVNPAPPKHVVIAGGAEGGAYAAAAKRYAAALKAQHIDAAVLTTSGAVENLEKLKKGEADIAIVQTGIAASAGADGVQSLGAVFYEPLWVFHRASEPVADLKDLKGKRIAIGAEGSGVRVLASLLLAEAGVGPTDFTAAPLSGAPAADALKKGDIDAALVVTGASADWIKELVGDPSIALLSMHRAGALSRLHPYLDPVTLYEGVLDLNRGLPDHDITLISPSAQLAVREQLHPAIQSLMIEAALSDSAGGSVLAPPGAFPSPKLTDIPLSSEARRYYKDGPSILRRFFPYAVANFLERAWVLAIPLLTLVVPLVRAAPPLYRWRIRRKIYVWYTALRALEAEGRAATTPEGRFEARSKLADMQAETGMIHVPLSYTDDLYRLRLHIRFVAELIDRLSAQDKYARV